MPFGSASNGQKTSPRGSGAHPPRSDEETTAPQREAYDCVVSCADATTGMTIAATVVTRRLISALSSTLEVYESPIWISSHQLDPHAVADVEPLMVPHDHSFRGWTNRSNERALLVRAGDDPVEGLADAIAQQQRRHGLADGAFDLVLRIFALGTALRNRRQLVIAVRCRLVGERRLDEPLCHEVGVTAIRRGCVRVVVRSEAEMPTGILARQVERVDPGSHELHDREREIGEAIRIGSSAFGKELGEGERVRIGGKRRAVTAGHLDDAPPALRFAHYAPNARAPARLEELRDRHVARDHEILDEITRLILVDHREVDDP